MRGKTALILINDPDYETGRTDGPFNGRAMTYYGRWTYKFEEAARQGARGALIVHDTSRRLRLERRRKRWSGPQAYARAPTAAPTRRRSTAGCRSRSPSRSPARRARLRQLSRMAKQPASGRCRSASPPRPASTTPIAVRLEERDRHPAGTTRPDEYVLHTAHWDHLGRCTANAAGDDICNGAIDNATGSAGLVALAEAHVKAGRPRARWCSSR
jgi:Zn-dependent M28 family amino/carboxypeptidase